MTMGLPSAVTGPAPMACAEPSRPPDSSPWGESVTGATVAVGGRGRARMRTGIAPAR